MYLQELSEELSHPAVSTDNKIEHLFSKLVIPTDKRWHWRPEFLNCRVLYNIRLTALSL